MADIWAARLLGEGGFQRLVAIKVITPGLSEDTSFQRMLHREALTVAAIRHPNVCQTLDFCEEDGLLFIVMEWVDGSSLRSLVRTGATLTRDRVLPFRLAARLTADACLGLHAAHELCDDAGHPLDLVHRDISPDNILLTRDGIVKVADFGIAKAMAERSMGSVSADFKGKFAYAAPERLVRQAVTRRADIFSIGCVLYQITTGYQPFDADNELAVVRKILDGEVTRPRELDSAYPLELEQIVLKALSRQPSDRHATARELAKELQSFAKGYDREATVDASVILRDRLSTTLAERDAAIRSAERSARNESSGDESDDDGDDFPTVALPPGVLFPAASNPGVTTGEGFVTGPTEAQLAPPFHGTGSMPPAKMTRILVSVAALSSLVTIAGGVALLALESRPSITAADRAPSADATRLPSTGTRPGAPAASASAPPAPVAPPGGPAAATQVAPVAVFVCASCNVVAAPPPPAASPRRNQRLLPATPDPPATHPEEASNGEPLPNPY